MQIEFTLKINGSTTKVLRLKPTNEEEKLWLQSTLQGAAALSAEPDADGSWNIFVGKKE